MASAYLVTRRLTSRTDYSFRDRTVVIAGGSRGLGLAMARCFADEGARVWLIARSADGLAMAAEDIASRHGRVRTVIADPEELRWFTAMSATPLTSMKANRAARQIVEACRQERATLTTAWQARLATVVNALAPETFATLNAAADRTLLPQPTSSPGGDSLRPGTTVDPGAVRTILPAGTRRQYAQPEPAWS